MDLISLLNVIKKKRFQSKVGTSQSVEKAQLKLSFFDSCKVEKIPPLFFTL